MGDLTDGVIALIVGKGTVLLPSEIISFDAYCPLELANQHSRWLVAKEQARVRSESPKTQLPMTLHAAQILGATNYGTFSPASPPRANDAPAILMPSPHFSNVHSHYTGLATHAVLEAQKRCHDDQVPGQPHKSFKDQHSTVARKPDRRKIADLDQIEPLNSRVREEIAHNAKVREQAAIMEDIRERQEKEAEEKWREGRKGQYPVSSYTICTDKMNPDDLERVLNGQIEHLKSPRPSPPPRPSHPTFGEAVDLATVKAENPVEQARVNWAPNLIQQKQRTAVAAAPAQRRAHIVPAQRRRSSNGPSNLRKTAMARE